MSNYLAVASVTAVLEEILNRAAQAAVPGLTANVQNPKQCGIETRGINIYLYQVTSNPAFRNADAPTRSDDGRILRRPMVPLDLHYLISFYGSEQELEPQRLMGKTVSALNARPVMSWQDIRDIIGRINPPHLLARSDLGDQPEMVKFTPVPMNLEEISRLWSVFLPAQYALSVVYKASVVLIEEDLMVRPVLPVRERYFTSLPFSRPSLESLSPQAIRAGEILALTGFNLAGEGTRIRFDGLTADPAMISDEKITVVIPPGLAPGVKTVRVIRDVSLGTPDEPHKGFESNILSFILVPEIVTPEPVTVARTATLTLDVRPAVTKTQDICLLAGDSTISGTLNPPGASAAGKIDFTIPATVSPGTYLMRIRVDGAESPLTADTDPLSPTFGQYSHPVVKIT